MKKLIQLNKPTVKYTIGLFMSKMTDRK